MTILSVLAIILMLLGLFFFLAGTIGLLRLPDFYSRLHAAGKCDSLAAVLMIAGMAAYNLESFSFGALLVSAKLFLIAAFVFVTSPTATHAITEAALVLGVKPWKRTRGKTTMIWQLDLMILTLVVICALVAINIKDLLGAAVVFGIYSFLMCLLWAEMGAVDVAFTEATVGAGVSTIFFIAAILRTTRRSRD